MAGSGKRTPIYVEIIIRGAMEQVWEKTQTPSLHEQWDLRFTDIKYLRRRSPDEPQRFLYTTRIGFGLSISGKGETIGNKTDADNRTSALRFWSAHPLSLIREGSGYWKYQQQPDNTIKFLTWYDYEPRFGAPGRVIDALLFRPLLGWATAWSFDNMRLWIERGIDPRLSRLRLMIDGVCRIGLAAAWIYQGLVPKLIAPNTGEIDSLMGGGLSHASASGLLIFVGIAQILFGLLFLLPWLRSSIYYINIAALIVLGLGGLFSSPQIFLQPFNPASLTIAMAALGIAGICASAGQEAPSARNCKRSRNQGDE